MRKRIICKVHTTTVMFSIKNKLEKKTSKQLLVGTQGVILTFVTKKRDHIRRYSCLKGNCNTLQVTTKDGYKCHVKKCRRIRK